MIDRKKLAGKHAAKPEQKAVQTDSPENGAPNYPGSKKGRPGKGARLFLCIFLVFALLLSASTAFIYSKLSRINFENVRSGVNEILSIQNNNKDTQEKDVINILLVGVDNDYLPGMQDRGNADGLMLLSINRKTKRIVLTSIMRDISIRVPDEYSTKATLVYHDFGLETLIETLEYNFEVSIDNYVLVNYFDVIAVVDALGGLELEITAAEIDGMRKKIENLNSLTGDPAGTDVLTVEDAGIRVLNGKQVAALLRIRNTGNNDFGRTERARNIVLAMKDKVLDMGLLELNTFADVVMNNITTDLTTTNILGLLARAPAYMKYDFISSRIPVEGSYTGDGSFIYIDYEVNRQALHENIYDAIETQ